MITSISMLKVFAEFTTYDFNILKEMLDAALH